MLARQGLHPDRRLASVREVARAGFGIHAARLASPVAIVAARAQDPDTALSTIGQQHDRGLTTIRCMRRTLHLFPVELATAAHYATVAYRERDALRLAARSGVSPTTADRVIEQIMALLGDGPLAPRMIETGLVREGIAVPAVRAGAKLAWERGLLTYFNRSGAWNREKRVFSLTATTVPELLRELDPRQAKRDLVAGYFDRYGPATLADVMWWSALSRRDVLTAMRDSSADLNVDWVQVGTPWSPSPAYMSARRREQFLAEEPLRDGVVALLAHEDVALKAYHETRVRYLGGLDPVRVFNRIGEALPTVVLDGQVIGRWEWDPRHRRVSTSLLARGVPSQVRADIAHAGQCLTATLRAGWSEPARADREVDPGQLSLTI